MFRPLLAATVRVGAATATATPPHMPITAALVERLPNGVVDLSVQL